MKNLTDLLHEAGARKSTDAMAKLHNSKDLVVELLSAFNNNPDNTKVTDYIFRKNLFDLIGKSRNESVHSKMIAELLSGRYFDISQKSTLIHFFDIVVMRAKEQGVEIPQEFAEAVLTRSIEIDSLTDCQTEHLLNQFKKDKKATDKNRRLDIFLQYNLKTAIRRNKTVEIFVENKVLSKEHDQQTQEYYDGCNDGRRAIQLFVYLSPISQRELSDYSNADADMKPVAKDSAGNPVYVHISYQDILDRIITPLLDEKNMNKRDAIILEEYANCLELPAMSDDVEQKDLSIMAISNTERKMLNDFMDNKENARLLDAAVNHHLGKKLCSFNGVAPLSFDQALQEALTHYIRKHGELGSMQAFKDIFGTQKGTARFLIYAVKETDDKLYYIPTHLYEYDGKAYTNLTEVLKVAVKDYIARTGKSTKEVIKDFEPLYAKVKFHQHVFKDTPDSIRSVSYHPTVFPDLFVRQDIWADKMFKINEILGDGFGICPITSECYHDLLQSGNDSLWECYDKRLFKQLPETNYWYRKGADNRLDKINSVLESPIIEELNLSKADSNLLEKFYKNNYELILSVYRILLENEQDSEIYEQRKKDYKRLVK